MICLGRTPVDITNVRFGRLLLLNMLMENGYADAIVEMKYMLHTLL